jgi:SAM-dependent methyltransferase
MGEITVSRFLDVFFDCVYGENYVNKLSSFFKKNKIKRILGCSKGINFPFSGLSKNGFEVLFCGSDADLISFKKNNFNSMVDCVLCRNDFLFLISDSVTFGFDSINFFNKINYSLKNLFNVLKPGGVLCVDLTLKNFFEISGEVFVDKFNKKISEKELTLIVAKRHLKEKKTSLFNSHVLEWDKGILVSATPFFFQSYLLLPFQLKKLLFNAGFKKVEELFLNKKNNALFFIAYK